VFSREVLERELEAQAEGPEDHMLESLGQLKFSLLTCNMKVFMLSESLGQLQCSLLTDMKDFLLSVALTH
jgi:hypothetical protein